MNKDKKLSKEQTLKLRRKHLAPSVGLFFENDPLNIIRGEGTYLFDENGNKYLDCINNVAHVGHCNSDVTNAAINQMQQLYTNSRFLHDQLSLYVKRLTSLFPAPLDTCFLVNSGSEANDMALQLAKTHTGGSEVIALNSAYHGTVTSCIEISEHKWKVNKNLKADFVHLASAPDSYRSKYNDDDDLGVCYAEEVAKITNQICSEKKKLAAFIMESMISCGGQIIPPKGYMTRAFQHVRDAGGVCIADEVQVGFGRVGSHFWAFQVQGAVPDIVTIGKPIGNGHPIAAVITTAEIANSFKKRRGSYFNTFAGNPVSCAIGSAVLDVIAKDELMQNAAMVGKYTKDELLKLKKKHLLIGDVR